MVCTNQNVFFCSLSHMCFCLESVGRMVFYCLESVEIIRETFGRIKMCFELSCQMPLGELCIMVIRII